MDGAMTERMSAAQYRALQLGGKSEAAGKSGRAKYGSRKVEQAGMKFDSEKELKRWNELCLLARSGHISDLRRQVSFELAPPADLGEARMKPALRYFADAVYAQDGKTVVEDVKSAPTRKKEAYRIKKHLMRTVHGILIKEV
jgi:hypothetical protein